MSARLKLTLNVLARWDLFLLTSAECTRLERRIGIDSPYVISPSVISEFCHLRGRTYNLIVFVDETSRTFPVENAETTNFCREVLIEHRDFNQTTSYLNRPFGAKTMSLVGVKKKCASDDALLDFYNDCRQLAYETTLYGYWPRQIDVHINRVGRFLCSHRALSRLAIAQLLGVKRIEARILSLSGLYLLNFIDRGRLWPGHLYSGVNEAIKAALSQASA